jgi:hypothetical protein
LQNIPGGSHSEKGVPVYVVTDQRKATHVLKAAPVQIKRESTGGKIARCLFAFCTEIEGLVSSS